MFNVGPLELLIVIIAVLVLFGPRQLPEMGKKFGLFVSQFRRYSDDLRSDFLEIKDDLSSELKPQIVDDKKDHSLKS